VESNWRWNVAFYGMDPKAVRLCARLLSNPDYLVTADEPFLGFAGFWYAPLGNPQEATKFATGYYPGVNFPFGNLVEPDRP